MRDEQYLTVGVNPIMPALSGQAIASNKTKNDNTADVIARLNRVRDEKFVPPDARNIGNSDDSDLTFSDLIDTINPLQHIPVVSSLYRAITGDEISPAARVAGDTIFLGPVGAIGALVDVGIDAITGNTLGEHAVGLFNDEEVVEQAATDTLLAQTPAVSEFAAGFVPADGIALPPTEEFSFLADPENVDGSGREPFMGPGESPGPAAMAALQPDTLAAISSETTVHRKSVQQPDIISGPVQSPATEPLPRWGLLSNDGTNRPTEISQPLISAELVAQAYEASRGETRHLNEPEAVGYQSGWFSTLMPEVIARYQHSATLQRQDQPSFVDIRD